MCLAFHVYRVAKSRWIRHFWEGILPPNADVSMLPCKLSNMYIYIYIYLFIYLFVHVYNYTHHQYSSWYLYIQHWRSVFRKECLGFRQKRMTFQWSITTIWQQAWLELFLSNNPTGTVPQDTTLTQKNDLWVEMSTSQRPICRTGPHLAWWICHSGHCMHWWLLLCRTYELKIPLTLAPPGKRCEIDSWELKGVFLHAEHFISDSWPKRSLIIVYVYNI